MAPLEEHLMAEPSHTDPDARPAVLQTSRDERKDVDVSFRG